MYTSLYPIEPDYNARMSFIHSLVECHLRNPSRTESGAITMATTYDIYPFKKYLNLTDEESSYFGSGAHWMIGTDFTTETPETKAHRIISDINKKLQKYRETLQK